MKRRSYSRGFTLIELLIVIAILSMMALLAAPRISQFFGNERQDSGLFAAYINATADNAHLNGKTNYLCISLSKPGEKKIELFKEKVFRANSLSVYNLEDNLFVQNNAKILELRSFSDNVSVKSVILEGGQPVGFGDVIIPFYSDGTSEPFVIEVQFGDSTRYIKKSRNSRTAGIFNELEN